jgi:hypothetical protein
MSFKSGIGSAAEHVFGEVIFELPLTLLSECDSIEGFVLGAIFMIIVWGIAVILLGLATVAGEALSARNVQHPPPK